MFPDNGGRDKITPSGMFNRAAARISSTPLLKRFRRGRPDRGRNSSR
jgi:hypothetical protein